MNSESSIMAQLMATIEDRKQNPPERSYTTKLFNGGVTKIGEKIMEEAAEVIEAAAEPADARHDHLVHETADLIYHLFVLLGHCEVPLADIESELASRFGISGLDEKAARADQRTGESKEINE